MDKNKKQYIEAILSAKKTKKYDQMLEAAQGAIQALPEDEDIKELLHDAQAYYVDEKLGSKLLDKLEENKDWIGLQGIYLRLLGIFPESKKLIRLLSRIKRRIQKQAEEEREAYFENAKNEILKLIKQGDLEDAEHACYEILSYDSERTNFIYLLAKIQHLIDKEIEKALSLYYKTTIPDLKAEYKRNKESFIRI